MSHCVPRPPVELVAWELVLLLLLCLVVLPRHLTQVVVEIPDVLRSLFSLSKACLMSLLVVLSVHLLPIQCCALLLLFVIWFVSRVS